MVREIRIASTYSIESRLFCSHWKSLMSPATARTVCVPRGCRRWISRNLAREPYDAAGRDGKRWYRELKTPVLAQHVQMRVRVKADSTERD